MPLTTCAYSTAQATKPVANALNLSGDAMVGNTLTGTYAYSDPFGNEESGSTAIWRRADDAAFTVNVTE